MVNIIAVRCTKCKTGWHRHNYHWKGRRKKREQRPQVDSKCRMCGGAVKRE